MALGQDTACLPMRNVKLSPRLSVFYTWPLHSSFNKAARMMIPSKLRVYVLLLPSQSMAAHSIQGKSCSHPSSIYMTWFHSYLTQHHFLSPLLTLSCYTELLAVSPRGQAGPSHCQSFLLPGTFFIAPLSLPSSVCSNVSFSMKTTWKFYLTSPPWPSELLFQLRLC